MSRRFGKLGLILGAILAVGCADAGSITDPAAPAPSFGHTVEGPDGETFTLLEGQFPAEQSSVSKTIGSLGGVLLMAGPVLDGGRTFHALVVPPGAVREPHDFVMSLGDDGHLSLDLRAFRLTDGGRRLGSGHIGFGRVPVYLVMNYAFSTTEIEDPSDLEIVYLVGKKVKEKMPKKGVSVQGKIVVAELNHFSRYAMAMN